MLEEIINWSNGHPLVLFLELSFSIAIKSIVRIKGI